MNLALKEFLFSKSILIGSGNDKNQFAVMFALAKKFDILITEGAELLNEDIIPFVADMLGEDVPKPFYRGFPRSVRELTPEKRLFDQLLNYYMTYSMGDFSKARHSVFESDFKRLAFSEKTEPKHFSVVSEEEALRLLFGYADDMLKSTRPLSSAQYYTLIALIKDHGYSVEYCACKDTAISLMIDTGDLFYCRFLKLADVIRLLETVLLRGYEEKNLRKLNLRNQDRKLICGVLDAMFLLNDCSSEDIRDCFEKKAVWCGLLHHLHYKPKTETAEEFVRLIRGNRNISVSSSFEKALAESDIPGAVDILLKGKGQGALLRNLNYILSRAKTEEDIETVIGSIDSKNAIILIQLLLQYSFYAYDTARTFKFAKFRMLNIHTETEDECERRRSRLSPELVETLCAKIRACLASALKDRLGRVYISPEMYSIAVPIQESVSNGGYGALPRGSRLKLEDGKKVRAFTYWEKVDDIDLSILGLDDKGEQYEFSWRNASLLEDIGIEWSNDTTSGYHGGSEYFDIILEQFKKERPEIHYLIFCDNVYSGTNFSECVCRAGYMLRDTEDTGEIFEPKTVKTSFKVTCESTEAVLFGIDLKTNEFVWLNVARNSDSRIAGTEDISYFADFFKYASVINLGALFEACATEVVDSPEDADVVVSDTAKATKKDAVEIRSHDFELITAILNKK